MARRDDRVVIFDFDHSLVDDNTDTFIPKMLRPGLLEHISARSRAGTQWTALMDEVAGLMHRDGVSRSDIEGALRGIPVHADMVAAVREAAGAGVAVHIVSDANEIYISVLLEHLGLADSITSVSTNAARWEGERMCISAFCDVPHGCERCPVNMCKAAVLQGTLRLAASTRVLYVGDGGGDVCPCLSLTS